MYGGLLSDYWFEEMNDRLLTRKFPEESKFVYLVLPHKDYILWGNGLHIPKGGCCIDLRCYLLP